MLTLGADWALRWAVRLGTRDDSSLKLDVVLTCTRNRAIGWWVSLDLFRLNDTKAIARCCGHEVSQACASRCWPCRLPRLGVTTGHGVACAKDLGDVLDRFGVALRPVWAVTIRVAVLSTSPACAVGNRDWWERTRALFVLFATVGALAGLTLSVAVTTSLWLWVLTLAILSAVWT